jgi:GGDEF domain-containing protein
MKKTFVPGTDPCVLEESVSSAWGPLLAPVRPGRGYLTVPLPSAHDQNAFLLCDPLTGLVAYPSFEAHMIAVLPELARGGLHLAIGDVDDLRGYITTCSTDDPTQFGHLAGNDCMRRVGKATRQWTTEVLDSWPFALCATFGGDEIIIAAAGRPYDAFVDALADLSSRIRSAAPRPCSFASTTNMPMECTDVTATDTYRHLVSRVDQYLLFHKAAARNAGATLDGALVDLRALEVLGHPDWQPQER